MARDIESLLRQQAALAAFGSYAFRETSLDKILTEAAWVCAESLGVRHCKVCRYRADKNDLLIEAGFGWNAGVVGRVVSQAYETSPQGRAFVTGEPVVVHNLKTANNYDPPDFYAEHNIISTVDVLIKAHGSQPFGVLEVDSTTEHSYDEHDVAFLTGFSNVLAEAVATATRNERMRVVAEELRASNESLAAALAEKSRLLEERDLLARELQHRVRNNLHMVNAMLSDRLHNTTDRAGQSGLRGIMSRVMTISEVYEHLVGHRALSNRVDFGAYGAALCNNLPGMHPAPKFPIALRTFAEEVTVSLSVATSLALVLVELVSNAYARRTGITTPDCWRTQLRAVGFQSVTTETVARESAAPNVLSVAVGYCQGTPMRNEIEAHDPSRLGEATDVAAAAIAARFGSGQVTGKIRAHIITAVRNS
jgi:two-component sensor histidine kinase